MELILENIAKHVSLTPEEQALFLSKLETNTYKAKTILLNAGEVCKHSYFVNSGILRSFNINDNIVEHVLIICLRRLVDERYVQFFFAKTRTAFY